jgi:hypothetical protein
MTNPTNENYLGVSCSGLDGATGRVLTLANTQLTVSNGFEVFLNGVFLTPTTQYTASHLTASSTVTFVGAVFNVDRITVIYYTTGQAPLGTYKYCTEQDVYNRCGLTASEVNLTTNTNIIYDAEAELELTTGRKFTDANSVTEYISGPNKDILGISGTKARGLNLSNYPIQSVSEFKQLNTDGTVQATYGTLTSVQIAAGTYTTTDYWLEAMEDQITNLSIPYGRITMKNDDIQPGIENYKVVYTYGYSSVPNVVKNLAVCLSSVRMWVQFMGGKYNRLDSYSIPQQTANKGDLFVRGERMIQQLTQEAERLYERIGKHKSVMLFATTGSR